MSNLFALLASVALDATDLWHSHVSSMRFFGNWVKMFCSHIIWTSGRIGCAMVRVTCAVLTMRRKMLSRRLSKFGANKLDELQVQEEAFAPRDVWLDVKCLT